ncbi:hypothetical protein [Comamonas sp. NoAH]|nr:hypothetical protein [Comamonas sp. NoAH]
MPGTPHHRVALAANVPQGHMAYYFQGMKDLLQKAFFKLADTM